MKKQIFKLQMYYTLVGMLLFSALNAQTGRISGTATNSSYKSPLPITTNNIYPKTFSHIGITVPNIKEAVKFYSEVMGWYIIMEPSNVKKEKGTAIGQMCIDVFGNDWTEFEIAHLSTSDGIGIELFSFPNGIKEAPEFNPFNTGLFHFSVQDPNIEELISKIVSYGGKQRMPIREYYPNSKPYKMCYVEDPFGIVFEIYTHSYELTYSSGAYMK